MYKKNKNEDLSSDDSADEEEILRNFDEEANLIIQNGTLPQKSSERYLLIYNAYKKWKEENKLALSKDSEERNLIVYFNSLKEKLKPPTLWSIWSMLRSTLNTKENIDLTKFLALKAIIKNINKGYKPKKSAVLTWDQVINFMTTADDHVYLSAKVILIFGICGALRSIEITNMKFEDVKDLGDKFLVTINYNKNDYPGQFIIGDLFYNKIQKYISLRPAGQFSDRFFIQYNNGKCTRQVIGKHKIGEVPEIIASYLNLENPKRFTGHCFRRTAATLLSNSGANMQMVKQLGRWRSDIIAQGYIENSLHNRELIYNGITHAAASSNKISPKQSTSNLNNELRSNLASTSRNIENDANIDENLNWSDFSEEFDMNEIDPISGKQHHFTTANKRRIYTPPNRNEQRHSRNQSFFSKSPVKLSFKKKHNSQEEQNKNTNITFDQDQNLDVFTNLSKIMKFENCTFNGNFIVNIHKCKCIKENSD